MTNNTHRTVLLALLCAALVAFVAPTAANHLQTDSGKAIAFDHRTGNDYWVEVVITGGDASRVAKVEAQTNGASADPWTTLEKKSWGAYAASFSIGTADVRFRATFTDGVQTVSCFFAHPSGVEKCSYPQPPGTWRSTVLGDVGRDGFESDSVLVDIDNDGVDELLVASESGLFRFDRTATGWSKQLVVPAPAPGYGFDRVVVGSTDGDPVEVYTSGHVYDGQTGANRIMWHHFTGTQWFSQEVWRFSFVHDMTTGDIDGDGLDELLAVTSHGTDDGVYAIERDVFAQGGFRFELLYDGNANENLGLIEVGDADRDGDDEGWLIYGIDDGSSQEGILAVDWVNGGRAFNKYNQGNFADEIRGFAVGDGDGNGNDEIHVLTSRFSSDVVSMQRFSIREGGFASAIVALGKGMHYDLVIGDGDGDGLVELYTGTSEGQLIRIQFANGGWGFRNVHQLGSGDFLRDLTVGDADGDGKDEVYGLSHEMNARFCCPATYVHRIALAGGGGTTSTTTTTTGGTFDATFNGVRGNEWWQQASVSATGGTLSKVDVRLNDGEWKPMAKQSYGYTSSYRAVQGTIVQFKATSTTGATDLSDCYRWIPAPNTDATKGACGSTSTTGGAFDATFSGVKGNDWWVQASVSANQPLQNVDARVDCSEEWRSLTKQSYGWAASFHVPAGSKVDFRAISTSGNMDFSGGYIWPNATPTSAC